MKANILKDIFVHCFMARANEFVDRDYDRQLEEFKEEKERRKREMEGQQSQPRRK